MKNKSENPAFEDELRRLRNDGSVMVPFLVDPNQRHEKGGEVQMPESDDIVAHLRKYYGK